MEVRTLITKPKSQANFKAVSQEVKLKGVATHQQEKANLIHLHKGKHQKDKEKRDRVKLLIQQKEANHSMEFDADETILIHQCEEKLRKANEKRERTMLLVQQKAANPNTKFDADEQILVDLYEENLLKRRKSTTVQSFSSRKKRQIPI